MRLACVGFAVAISIPVAARADNAPVSVISDLSYISPDRLVDIGGGRHMNIHCVGHGSPTVIFEAGLGDQIRAWAMVQPAVAASTQACSYDRAGLGFSDPSDRPGTSENAVADLHHLLAAASIGPPYILVGHSLGGMYVRLYADHYRSEVVGLVLVDSVSEEQGPRFSALDPPSKKLNHDYVESLRTDCIPGAQSGFKDNPALREKCAGVPDPHFSDAFNQAFLSNHSRPEYFQAVYSEFSNVFTVSSDQVRAARQSLGDMPVIAFRHAPFPLQPNETQEMRDAKNKLWIELQDELASLSSRGADQVVPGASHYIQFDDPDVVIAAIVREVRSASHLLARSP